MSISKHWCIVCGYSFAEKLQEKSWRKSLHSKCNSSRGNLEDETEQPSTPRGIREDEER